MTPERRTWRDFTAYAGSSRARTPMRVAALICAVEALLMIGVAVWIPVAGRQGRVGYEIGIAIFAIALALTFGWLALSLFRGEKQWRGLAITLQLIVMFVIRIPDHFWLTMLARAPVILAAVCLFWAIRVDPRED